MSLRGARRLLGELGVGLVVLLARQMKVPRQPRHVLDVVVAQDIPLVGDEAQADLEGVL